MPSPAPQRKQVKAGVAGLDESRRRREAEVVEIRKSKKDDMIAKKRNMFGGHAASSPSVQGPPSVDNLSSIIQGIRNSTGDAQLEFVIQLRKLLSIEKNPPIQQTLATGILPGLISLLTSPSTKMQFESAWAITNIASGTSEQTVAVVAAGAVPYFVTLLGSPDAEIREQAVWALGNIAGDSAQCRDFVLQHNVLAPLLQVQYIFFITAPLDRTLVQV